MDIFNRKKLAAAEAEIVRLKEYNRFQQVEQEKINDILQQRLNSENKELKKKLREAESEIIRLNKYNRQQNGNQQLEDIEIIEDDYKPENAAYIIRDEIIDGKISDNKKIRNKFVASIYNSCKSFFSQNEFKFYEMLSDLSLQKDFILFSKIRMADIIEMWEKFYDEKSMVKAKEQNPRENGTVFLNALNKYSFKKQIYDRIQTLNPDFNDRDYQTAFLYPLLRLHIDFLLCKKVENNILPLVAIELNGEDHYKDWTKIKNDNFKKSVFFSDYVYIGFLSVYNDVLNNDEDRLREIMSNMMDDLSNKEMLITWKGIQKTLNNLAKPYLEKLVK